MDSLCGGICMPRHFIHNIMHSIQQRYVVYGAKITPMLHKKGHRLMRAPKKQGSIYHCEITAYLRLASWEKTIRAKPPQ